ncbi:MAG: hypothetical protein FD145_1155 [Candidatus Saganbacteria bacterium]|uniref:Uncharacterized protein n=1 Tax=Candidatus Saganbacteria bacterium TaxID=2575572 RepID=A0A833NY96_UNCSA|nr:MAG: hypothetical protein FD145_1155 [Candidatus Saganbacteria bacterium]
MNKKIIPVVVLICVFLLGLIIYGCGKIANNAASTSTTSGNYTVSGKVGTITTSGLNASANNTVTHIVAIGADNNKTLITPESNGTFSLQLSSGQPYVFGFFNKTGSTITLLGYLKKSDYDWDSLPIISPTGSSTNLGTVEINTTSAEAIPSINITSLIAEMNMTAATADLYGKIDDSLAALTNLDLDGNGEFDFNENKNYLFQTFIGMYDSGNPATGEVDSMIDGYNDTYIPRPSFYQIYFSGLGSGDTRTAGTSATLTTPSAIGGATTQTAAIGATSDGNGWTLFFTSVSTPEIAPSGTYTVRIGTTTYTINNFKASDVVAIGSNNNIVFPVFHLVTNSAGKITTVQYKWKKLVNGVVAAADAAEVRASINYNANATNSFTQNPFISFFADANTLHPVSGSNGLVTLDIDKTEVDVSGLNKARTDIHHIQAGYELTSKVICKFDLY